MVERLKVGRSKVVVQGVNSLGKVGGLNRRPSGSPIFFAHLYLIVGHSK